MDDLTPQNPPQKPPRRKRYRGKNPRRFQDKYKEHQPERYPDDVAKVLSGGKTPAGTHRPIMVREIMDVLAPKPGDIAVDCTLGYGGHARELLKAIQPGGQLLALDADPLELPKSEARLRALGFGPETLAESLPEKLIVRRMNFAGLAKFLAEVSPAGADVILADLGLSSMQIDNPARGFTFKADGPLDMRMNPAKGLSASDLLSTLDEAKLRDILVENSDEPFAAKLAKAILTAHARQPLTTTRALADIVRSAVARLPRSIDDAPDQVVRRVFQSLRIAVNDELVVLDAFLRQLPYCLKPGGRVAILTFHSGEDRRVKTAFKRGLIEGLYATISRDVVRASADEQRAQPALLGGETPLRRARCVLKIADYRSSTPAVP